VVPRRDAVASFLRRAPLAPGHRWRVVATRASGQPAFGLYRWKDEEGAFIAHDILVLTLDGPRIAELVAFLEREAFRHFDLPAAGRRQRRRWAPGLTTRGDQRGGPDRSPRLWLARDLDVQAGAAARWAVQRERAVERGDAVAEAAQARALGRVGAADAVVGDVDGHAAVRRRTATVASVAWAYFATFASASETTK
jgi:hypothetical protein